ncbi:grasp-with-spasm system A modified peptide [Microscilla marina]|uniref:Uncharacterized protein n=1 Tax=Microscilla marina ATCC 23134 TaxID=313606 RepID=A1ZQ37_MICM2|nr:grasp-with-spasm system A modified peptide [Microscilla marina]EAY27446.1 hypothetical protein M23134_06847 [Microscilla marina ATCC 23134]
MKKLSKLNSDLFSNQKLNNIQKQGCKGGYQGGIKTIYNDYPGGPVHVKDGDVV